MTHVGPHSHAPPWQSHATPHALVDLVYPHCTPDCVQALPIVGSSAGQAGGGGLDWPAVHAPKKRASTGTAPPVRDMAKP
jgi:hypothetical protein